MKSLAVVCGACVAFSFLGLCCLLPLAGTLLPEPPPNGRCPACMTPCYIRGAERMTFAQQGAIHHRCPTCGGYEAVLIYRAMGGFAPGRSGGVNEGPPLSLPERPAGAD